MAARITFSELQKKLRDPNITEKQLRGYFLIDLEQSRAFEPVLVKITTSVDKFC